MNLKTIKDIAFTIKYCKDNGKPMPIILCGAGISKTAGIPLAGKIIEDVYKKFSEKSEIIKLKARNSTDYYEIMRALRAEERQDLFKGYIESKEVRLNLASIYIAQLLKEKYVDFVFTVNFDDVLLKASSLFNFIPPIYDLANISNLNSNGFVNNSLIYLHGQYYGQWLLNTQNEIDKGLQNVHNLFQRECNRPWIVVGYSGEDEVFGKLNEIQSFSSDLYWVSYDDNTINSTVKEQLLEQTNKNAYLISDIDADTFFLELCTELGLEYPPIFDKPFTFLESYFDKIQDFNAPSEKYQSIYQNLSKQKEISFNWILKAKVTIENKKSLEQLQQEIIDSTIKADFNDRKAKQFLDEIGDKNYKAANEQLSWYFGDWGNSLLKSFRNNNDEKGLKESFVKYEKAIKLNPNNDRVFNNYGIALADLAIKKKDENLFEECYEKYKKGSELNPKNEDIFRNWGIALHDLGKIKKDEKKIKNSFEKYKKAMELNPKDVIIYNNWGIALNSLAFIKQDEKLFHASIKKYQKATELNPKDDNIYNNWGIALYNLATLKKEEALFEESFLKYQISSELNPKKSSSYYNWGLSLHRLAEIKQDQELYEECFLKYKKASEINPKDYFIFQNWGFALKELAKMKKDDNLFEECFAKYKKVLELNPKDVDIYDSWGSALSDFAKIRKDENLWSQAEIIFKKGVDLGGDKYNLSCLYALKNNKEKALDFLEKSLENKETTPKNVEKDDDWNNLKNDEDFKFLLAKHK